MNRVHRRSPLALIAFLLIALLAFPAVGQASATAMLSGSVSGDSGPLAGATIEIFHYGGGLVTTATSDAAGHFAAAVPASGDRLFWVRAWAADHDSAEQVWVRGRESSIRFHLTALYGSVSGWVLGTEGSAVNGARVELVHPTHGSQVAATAPSGRFWFTRVPAGEGYSLRVSAAGFVPVTQPVGLVTAGRETALTAALTSFRGMVAGAVVDQESGAALTGAAVDVEQVGLGIVASTVTGTGGSFTAPVDAVAGATFRVHARLNGYRPVQTAPFALDGKGLARLDGEGRIKLARLTADLSVRVLDPDGDPLPGAPLWLEREGAGIVATGETLADGTYRFEAIPAGDLRYRVRLVPPTMRKQSTDRKWGATASEWITPPPGQWANLGLSLVAGEMEDYGDSEVMGRVTSPGQFPVAGAKVDLIRAGEGVVATTETAADGSYHFFEVEANQPLEQVYFRGIPMKPAGLAYLVRVSHGGFHTAASEMIDLVPDKQTLVDLALSPVLGTAAVHVVDQDGLPVAGAKLRLRPARGGEPVESAADATGTGRLQAPLLGAYWLEVEKEGYQKGLVSPLLLEAGQEKVVDVTVGSRTATLYGHAVDAQGRPVTAPLTVTAVAANGREVSEQLRPDGSYALSNLPAGAPVLVSLRDGQSLLAAPAQVLLAKPGERVRADLTLTQPTGTVRGRVVDESGRPVVAAVVDLMRSGDGVAATVLTDANGFYQFDLVPADLNRRYAVRLSQPGFGYRQLGNRMPPPLFLLEAGGTKHVDLVLVPLEK